MLLVLAQLWQWPAPNTAPDVSIGKYGIPMKRMTDYVKTNKHKTHTHKKHERAFHSSSKKKKKGTRLFYVYGVCTRVFDVTKVLQNLE